MASGNPTRKSLKSLIICALVGLALLTVVVWSYLGVRADALHKTKPYAVQLQVLAFEAASVSVDYDYGYGFNAGHQRKLQLSGDKDPQLIGFSISAWKDIQALRINGFDGQRSTLLSFMVKKGSQQYQLDRDQLKSMLAGGQLLISEINSKLEQAE